MIALVKLFLSAGIIVVVSEVGKRNSLLAGVLASLPLTSLLAFISLYMETGDAEKVVALSQNIFWLIIPSLTLFITLPWLIKRFDFFWALGISSIAMIAFYYLMVYLLTRIGITG